MYKQVRIKKLGRKKSHRESLINNQLRSVFESGYVRTTSVKARVLKTNIERLLSDYSESLSFRRNIGNTLGNRELVERFYTYVKKENKGVKIMKLGFRPGDMSEMSRVELMNFKEKKVKKENTSGDKKDVKKKEVKKDKEQSLDKKKAKLEPRKILKPEKVVVNKERAKSRSGL